LFRDVVQQRYSQELCRRVIQELFAIGLVREVPQEICSGELCGRVIQGVLLGS
jgi:hypothetical protein